MPDDALDVADSDRVERPRRVDRPELDAAADDVGRSALGDDDVPDGLAVAQGNVPIPAMERADERDRLVHGERAVLLYGRLHDRVRERVAPGARSEDQGERNNQAGPGKPRQKRTCGASRAASSSSKNSRGPKPKAPATRLVGTVCTALL